MMDDATKPAWNGYAHSGVSVWGGIPGGSHRRTLSHFTLGTQALVYLLTGARSP